MSVCLICKKTHNEVQEWRPCPLYNKELICATEHCLSCEYWRDENQKGFVWCTYHIKHSQISKERQVQAQKSRIAIIKKEMQKAYQRNWPQRGQELEEKVMQLTFKLRALEKDK